MESFLVPASKIVAGKWYRVTNYDDLKKTVGRMVNGLPGLLAVSFKFSDGVTLSAPVPNHFERESYLRLKLDQGGDIQVMGKLA